MKSFYRLQRHLAVASIRSGHGVFKGVKKRKKTSEEEGRNY
jgi:hypothetical protein